MKILVLNGPSLNMLGIREPEVYGYETYDDLVEMIKSRKGDSHDLSFYQSNHEGALIDTILEAHFNGTEGIVFNPGAYTHTSIALMDAIAASCVPTVEVHISDTQKREAFRKISYVEQAAIATVQGKGFAGYIEAIDILENNAHFVNISD